MKTKILTFPQILETDMMAPVFLLRYWATPCGTRIRLSRFYPRIQLLFDGLN